jgi:Raf kinase inhibitor-like YbhB/YbcL family protein
VLRVGIGRVACACLALVLLLAACGGSTKSPAETPSPTGTPRAEATPTEEGGDLRLSSEAFANEETIPTRYTCDGDNLSPALSWSGVPQGTEALALIADDPDAPGGTFTHWVLLDLPAEARELPEGVETVPMPANGLAGAQGSNDGGGIGYTGPCPPSGPPHRYRFTLYALDVPVNLDPGAQKQEVLSAMEGHILAKAELVGTYGR